MASEQRRQDERRIRTATRWLAAGSLSATAAFGGLAAAVSHAAGTQTSHSDSSSSSTPSDTFTPQQSFAPPVAQSGASQVTTSPAVWYLMRSSGIVALLLLTAAFGLGVATSNRWRPAGARLYVTTQIHRNASLLAVVFLAVHIVTSVVDPDAQVGFVSALTPFGSSWSLAVGALSLDLIVALVVTSLGRRRLSYPVWRLIHWSAYAAWPLAVAHGLDMGTDARVWWSELVTVVCIGAMGGAVTWRILRPLA